MTFPRKLIAALSLAAILAVAITPVAPGLLLALLVPLFFFVAPVASAVLALKPENESLPSVPFLAVAGSRGPPNACLIPPQKLCH